MNERVPVTIAARNEEATLGPCLDALLASARHASLSTGAQLELLVVADDCTDRTADVARSRGVRVITSTGGKVEAQRAGVRAGPFSIFVDADVLVTEGTLGALVRVMRSRPEVFVATPMKLPLPPVACGRLARALHVYNRERGFSSQRTWFNGKCFAIRRWSIPTREEVRARSGRLAPDRFYDYEAGIRADDIYLSRRIARELGAQAFAETDAGCVLFRAPETLRGMYRYYRRMRMELERISVLFPELEPAHVRFGVRRADTLGRADRASRVAFAEFSAWLGLCRVGYRMERLYYQHVSTVPCSPWPPIEETKCALAITTDA